MIWLYRLYNLPVLVGLHYLHTVEFVRVQHAQHVLFEACSQDSWDEELINMRTSNLELHLEKIADIDERMMKLWQRR